MQEDLQRAIGRVEGTTSQILSEIRRLQDQVSEHINQDQSAFSSVRVMITDQKDSLTKHFEAQTADRDRKFRDQLEALTTQSAFTRGAWWIVTGILGGLATVVTIAVSYFRGGPHH